MDRITVLTPCSPRSRIASDGETQIDALYTYLVVRTSNVSPLSSRQPDLYLDDERVSVYMFHREEITIENDPGGGVYLPFGDPGFPDVPARTSRDPRWIAHMPLFVPEARVKERCYDAIDPAPELCTRLVARFGEFSGEFPCGVENAHKRKMTHTSFEGFLAQEMVITLPAATGLLSLQCRPFSNDRPPNRIILETIAGNTVEAFFVTGPLVNVIALANFNPCVPNDDHGGHSDADYEFETLWDLFDLPEGAPKPVPEIPPIFGPRADCVPGGGG